MPKRRARTWEETAEGEDRLEPLEDSEAERSSSEAATPASPPSRVADAVPSDVGPDSVRIEYLDLVRDGRPVRAVVSQALAQGLGSRVRILEPGD